VSLKIAGEHGVSVAVINCWHLKEETLVRHLLGFLKQAGVSVKNVGVLEEFVGEATEDQDVLVVSLHHSATLSVRELARVHFNQGPCLLAHVVVSLD